MKAIRGNIPRRNPSPQKRGGRGMPAYLYVRGAEVDKGAAFPDPECGKDYNPPPETRENCVLPRDPSP